MLGNHTIGTAEPIVVLSYRTLADVFAAHQLPSYRYLANGLDSSEWVARQLLRDLAGLVPGYPAGAEETAEEWLLMQLENLFPMDYLFCDEILYQAGEHLVGWGAVPFAGQGLPWEAAATSDLPSGALPLLALVGETLEIAEGFEDAAGLVLDELAAWRTARMIQGQPVWCIRSVDEILPALRALTPPLNGLAGVYLCLRRDSGNPFLNLVMPAWAGEYETDEWYAGNWFDWSAEAIRELADLWQQVKPDLDAMEQYVEWYEATPEAEQLVLQQLEKIWEGDHE